MRALLAVLVSLVGMTNVSCRSRMDTRTPSPVSVGLNSRDLVDPVSQQNADAIMANLDVGVAVKQASDAAIARAGAIAQVPRNVLCISGGGAYGAYPAGVLCGWTESGTRPVFDVVTGISTGALLAPFAFLGPKYDGSIREFYTQTRTRDIYKTRPVRGLVSEALADNSPLRKRIDELVTPELVAEIALAHQAGRRLFVGTTELEGRRFIIWDIGGIACRGRECDRELIRDILTASSSIPGFFPPVRIAVNVDGRNLVEKHGDGGVTQGIFFRPPWPPSQPPAGTRVWCVVAGKLYVDPAPVKPRALSIASHSVSDIIYAQTRGDLQRIYTLTRLNGMDFQMTAIPEEFPAPAESTEFEPKAMQAMFDEGFRLARCGSAWRNLPPGMGRREAPQERSGTCLTQLPNP